MNPTCTEEVRGRRTPQRSRYGCRNCKLRKVKCDQGKPLCKRCTSFGVLCNFLPNVPDLQPISADTGWSSEVRGRAHRIQPHLTNAVWTSDASSSYQLNAKCQDFITRYLGRSLVTITPDDPHMVQVNRQLLDLAFAHPYLMHASLAVAFAYDRFLNGFGSCQRTPEEAFHSYRSLVLYNRRLKEPIEAKDKDPIWGTAAALVVLTFSSPDASTPERAWPLKPPDSSDLLDWLNMSMGKMSLWNIIDPLRPGSIFRVMAGTYAHFGLPLPERGIDGIPSALAAVCNLRISSTAEDNPYFHAAHAVSQIMDLPDAEITTGYTQLFMRVIHGAFKELLLNRDPVALLLFYLWYRAASRGIWWVELRARVECRAICLYLRRYHAHDEAVQAFLPGGALSSW